MISGSGVGPLPCKPRLRSVMVVLLSVLISRQHPYLIERGGFAAGPLGLSVEVHVNFDKNLTMLVEKF